MVGREQRRRHVAPDCKLHTVGVAQKVNKVMVLPKVGGEIFWDDSEWAVKVRHPTIPSSCCRDSPLALICLSESSYSWHPKDGTLILEMRLTLALLQFCAVLKLEIQKHQSPAFFSRDLSHLRIFLILAPERWNSDIRNSSDFAAWLVLLALLLKFCAVLKSEL